MNKICDEKICTGCMACYNICPQRCIKMEYNKYGELQPEIDEEKCINCGLCRRVCPNNSEIKSTIPQKAYAVWAKKDDDRKKSTSGGAAAIFYREAIKNKYIVFGTSFDNNLILKHSYTDNIEELDKYRESKYCQSNVEDCYIKVKNFLKDSNNVLFIGTPCQIQGLNKYLEISNCNKDKLVTVDLVCHGVPSQEYLSEYVQYLENKKKEKANKISFRKGEKYVFTLSDGEKTICELDQAIDLYLTAFSLSILQRESCMNCKYAKETRVSDITIGDFWGIKEDKDIKATEKEKGISLVLINTSKGNYFFELCKKEFSYFRREINEAIQGNTHLRRSSTSNKYRYKFRKQYENGEFVKTIKKVIGWKILNKKIRKIIKSNVIVRKVLKK